MSVSDFHSHTAFLSRQTSASTGIGRKNETEVDIFTTLTNSLGHLKSSFFSGNPSCLQAVYNCKQLAYWKLDLGSPQIKQKTNGYPSRY